MATDPRLDPSPDTAGFAPASAVAGEVAVPASKSIAQRMLVGALLAQGTTDIAGLPSSDDVMHALRCARAAGATFPSEGRKDDLLATALLRRRGLGRLAGAPLGDREGPRPWCTLPVGESGTAARLFTAICALARPEGSGAEVIPSGTLAARSSPALFEALRAAGAGIEHARGPAAGTAAGTAAETADGPVEGGWPVLLTAAEPPDVIELVHPSSSQEVSALLFALAAHRDQRRLRVVGEIPSRGYVDVTCGVLEAFGALVSATPMRADSDGAHGEVFVVKGPLSAPRGTVHIEADASAAAVALAAGAVSGGGTVIVTGVGRASTQPDAAIVRALTAFGVDTSESSDERLVASGEPSQGAVIDCSSTPDLAPVLAAVGAFCARRHGASTELLGLGTLPGKESSRIEVLADGLRAIGLSVSNDDRSLRIDAGEAGRQRGSIVLDPRGDHRMAFAFALLSLFEPNVRIESPGCVAKSWPRFWTALESAGAVPGVP